MLWFELSTRGRIIVLVVYFIIFHVAVLTWQVVGLLRACDHYIKKRGSYVTAWSAQSGIVVCLLFTIVFAFTAFQSHFSLSPSDIYQAKMEKLDEGQFSLTLSEDKTRLHVVGDFKIGITRELTELLERHPAVREVVLDSNGGHVTEGRGVARLIKKKGLDTYVFKACKSACMTAFAGGAKRYMGRSGKLGFHQYGLNTEYQTSYFKPEDEQKIDLEFYREQKIDSGFLEKIFKTVHEDIWFPTHDELLSAGVVHKILDDR